MHMATNCGHVHEGRGYERVRWRGNLINTEIETETGPESDSAKRSAPNEHSIRFLVAVRLRWRMRDDDVRVDWYLSRSTSP
jgi:hypothetical protein